MAHQLASLSSASSSRNVRLFAAGGALCVGLAALGIPVGPAPAPRQVALRMLAAHGWAGPGQFACLDALWERESGWNPHAENPASGAYGIPQAVPGSKMASAGPDWRTDAATQIRWGLGYIRQVYGTPCGAWTHEQADGWYSSRQRATG